jgi:enoyl-CoA hydratase
LAKRILTTVRAEQRGRVLMVTLDNPPSNFLNRQLVFELHRLIRGLERDGSVGAVVLTGAHPRSFITHYDVAEILTGAEVTPDVPPVVLGGVMRAVALVSRIPGAADALVRSNGVSPPRIVSYRDLKPWGSMSGPRRRCCYCTKGAARAELGDHATEPWH